MERTAWKASRFARTSLREIPVGPPVLDSPSNRRNVIAMNFPQIDRITIDPTVMGGKPCIRGTRVTVGTIAGLVASGAPFTEILALYPYLREDDLKAAMTHAACLGVKLSPT